MKDEEKRPVDGASLATGCFLGLIGGLLLAWGSFWVTSHLALVWHG